MEGQEVWTDYILHNFEIPTPQEITNITLEINTETIPEEFPVSETHVLIVPEPIIKTETLEEFYCLPAFLKKIKDTFYEEYKTRLSYGNPHKFSCELLKQLDFGILIKTTELSLNSILYQKSMKRWWKISRIHQDFSECIISDLKPDFSSVK
jgi:hypothetical protein